MNANREEVLFALALEKPAAERVAFLDAVCGGDAALRARLETLLAAHDAADALPEPAEPVRTIKLELEDAPDESIGQKVGRYKILERVGEGGCGVVYVAEQTEPVRRRVALKVIKLGMDTKQVVARFEAERQALAMMDHPNIAKVLDAGTTETGRPYFVMELVRGIKITDYCDQAQLSTKERLDLFIKVCQAIQHAHQKGIIHRDIKPSNILVTLHDGVPVPKVIDFGIAKATEGRLTDATVYTQLNQFIGTPAYMSPEQAEMSGLDIDTRSDIYSLGVLLYELLAGSTPFDGKELMSLGIDGMRKTIREKEPQRPSTKLSQTLVAADVRRLKSPATDTPGSEEEVRASSRRLLRVKETITLLRGDLDWIVMKCLEKDRSRRYESANGLAMDLKRHLNHEPVVARPPSTAYRLQKAWRRNKLVFASGAAVVAALVFGVVVSVWQATVATSAKNQAIRAEAGKAEEATIANRERDNSKAAQSLAENEQQRARRLLYAADMNLAQQALKLNDLGRARRLLDRHRPQPGEEDLRGWEWRYLWQQTRSSALVTLTNRPVRGFDVSFSPDGTRLAVGWWDGQVDLWDVPGRRLLKVLTVGADFDPAHVAFSPVRNLLAAASSNNVVTLFDLDSGLDSVLWQDPDNTNSFVRDISFSPDGSKVVIYAPRDGSSKLADVFVVNVSSSQIESRHPTLFDGAAFFGAARLSPDNQRLYLARSGEPANRYSIQCLDLATGREIWQTDTLRDEGLSALALSPDGKVLVSGSGYADPAIRVWDAQTGRLVRQLDGHTSWVSKLVFSPDGRQLVSSAADQTIRLWDTGTWTESRVLRGNADEVHGVALSGAAHLIASASKDGNLMLWQADGQGGSGGYTRLPEDLGRRDVWPLDGSRVLLLPPGKPLELFDLKSDAPPTSLTGLGTSNLLGWPRTNILCQWNGTNRIVVLELHGSNLVQKGSITVDDGLRPNWAEFNAARQSLAWTEGTNATSVLVASLAAPDRRIQLKSDAPGLLSVRWSDDGNYLFGFGVNGNGRFLRAWTVETGRIVASTDELVVGVPTFAAGGRVLVVPNLTGSGHEIAFFDLAQPGSVPKRFPGKYFFGGLAVSPDGRLVASTSEGGVVSWFDASKGELIESIHGHLNGAFGVAFSPNGKRLITASGGRQTVKLWDVGTRQELLTLSGIGGDLEGACWSRDGDVILAGAPWQAWRAPSWKEIAAAEAKDKAETQPQ